MARHTPAVSLDRDRALREEGVPPDSVAFAGRLWPALLAIAFLAVATFFNLTYPLWEGSDEPQHFEQIRYLARDHALPRPVSWATTQRLDLRNMSHHPPVYYALQAGLLGWLLPGGEGRAWRANPFVTWPGHAAAQALAVHTPDEDFPYAPAVLAGHAARLVSSLLGLLIVLAAYLLAREVLSPGVALFAAGVVAFTPGVVYLSATINNEVGAAAFAGLALACAVRLVRRGGGALRYGLLVGGLAALAGLCKLTGFYVVPVAALAGLLAPFSPSPRREGGGGVGRPPLPLGEGWGEGPLRERRYGHGRAGAEAGPYAAGGRSGAPYPPARMAGAEPGPHVSPEVRVRLGPLSLWERVGERASGTWRARLLYLALAVGLPALAAGAWYWSARADWDLIVENSELASVGSGASAAWLLTPFDLAVWPRLAWALPRLFSSYWGVLGPVSDAYYLPMAFYLAAALLVALAGVGLAAYLGRGTGWRSRPWSCRWAQALVALAAFSLLYAVVARTGQARTAGALDGRHLLAVAGALGALLAGGLAYLAPGRWRAWAAAPLLAVLLAASLAAPAFYSDVVGLPHAEVVAGGVQPGAALAKWANGLALLDVALPRDELRPGAGLSVTLTWRVERRLEEDFQVALLAVARDGKPYLLYQKTPLVDVLPPSWWLPGDVVADRFALTVPANIPLGRARLEVHVVRAANGDPIPRDQAGLKPLFELGEVAIRPPAVPGSAVSRSLAARFGENMELVGLSPAELRAPAGGALALNLYWRATAPLAEDLVVSLQLLDAQGKLAAQTDAPPLEGRYPTSQWPRGDLVADSRSLAIPAGAAPGQYELRAIVYRYPSLERLRLPADQGGADYLPLGRVEVTR